MVRTWNEAEHPRDDNGRFTDKGGGGTSVSTDESNERKMQTRADILYGNDEDYIKKYYGNKKETDILKRYENRKLENFKQNIQDNSKEVALIRSNNAQFSDSTIKEARNFIQGSEGFRADAHKPTKNDVWTIGYGHTGKVDGKTITPGMVITKEKAEELYRKDFESHIKPLSEVTVPLTNNQKIALSSLIYNIGPGRFKTSTLLKKLNAGDFKGAADEFDVFIKQTNKTTGELEVVKGLVNRRKREKRLFLTPDGE